MNPNKVFERLEAEVVRPGLCTHCGTCAGLSSGTVEMRSTPYGPLPAMTHGDGSNVSPMALDACPGKSSDYPALCASVFGKQPENWLMGCYRKLFVGHSGVPEVRRAAASGGVITQTLLHLLESGQVDGVVAVRQGSPQPWEAQPVIATSPEEIRECSQSVYAPVSLNTILPRMEEFNGTLAYVGLPDQVASLRRLQQLGHPGAAKVTYVLGPYVGVGMYLGAIESYLRSNGIESLSDVARLRYREGEWPGYLEIVTRSGRVLRAEKFYYNYLIPFFITRATLLSVDFTNELADISVGDAWHPRYESQGGGFSVVVARTEKSERILDAMEAKGLLRLEPIPEHEAVTMHAHMLDFKKRGAFIRMSWRKALGKPVPEYGYRPADIPLKRKLAEIAIVAVFQICGTRPARRLVETVPISVLGPVFNFLRKAWKRVSKPTKRAGLYGYRIKTMPLTTGLATEAEPSSVNEK